jgi:hypothetical protein
MEMEERNFDDFFNLKKKISRIIKKSIKYSYVSYEPLDPDKTAEEIHTFLLKSGFIRTVGSIKQKDLIKN